jgi:hypothetical protein
MEALAEWLWQRRPRSPPRDLPRLVLEELPPELREEVGRHAGLRPLLRLARMSTTMRDHVDRLFVLIFNRDIVDVLAPPWTDLVAIMNMRRMVLTDPTGKHYPEHREAELPYIFLQLLFLPRPYYIYDLAEAHQQKLNLCAIYLRVCEKLANRFVFELEVAYRNALEEADEEEIRWLEPTKPERSFVALISPPSRNWLLQQTDSVIVFKARDPVAPEILRHVQALRRLAPSIGRLATDETVCAAWVNAFMNLLLDVSMGFVSFMKWRNPGQKRLVRTAGLSTLTRPKIIDMDEPEEKEEGEESLRS